MTLKRQTGWKAYQVRRLGTSDVHWVLAPPLPEAMMRQAIKETLASDEWILYTCDADDIVFQDSISVMVFE
jgi:hypothetical protein